MLVCDVRIEESVFMCAHTWHLGLLHLWLPSCVLLCRFFFYAVMMLRRLGGCRLALIGGFWKIDFILGSDCRIL